MYENMAILGAFIFLYSIVCGRLERMPISGAIVFAAFGFMLGPIGLKLLNMDINAESLRSFAELTLALVLFTDAANAHLGILKKNVRIPVCLLLVGLPLTILFGFGAGVLIFNGLSLFEIAILATILAPTDAALGKAVVTNKAVPMKIREGLNVESGLNDGICVPILFVFLALAANTNTTEGPPMLALKLVSKEIGIGVVSGIGLTIVGIWLLTLFAKRGWITETWHQVPVPAMAVICFAVAQWLGGSGFIASYVGGLVFGGIEKGHKYKLLLAAEATGDTLALITWVIFGAAVIGQSISFFSWQIVLYTLLSLTLIRMVPVFLVLAGTNLRMDEKLFIGWFGPRGLASVVFAVIVLNKDLPGGSVIAMTAACTIVMSIIAHGLSANPLVVALATRMKNESDC